GHTEVPAVGLESKGVIRLDGVEAGVLKRVCLKFRHEADAAAFLVFIDHQPATFGGDCPHRDIQLIFAVATQRSKRFAREALRVDPQQRRVSGQLAHYERGCRFDSSRTAQGYALKSDYLKVSPPHGHARARDASESYSLSVCHRSLSSSVTGIGSSPRTASAG